MSPSIALLACLFFILILFRFDAKQKSDVSASLWIPTVWMLILGSRMISLWLNLNTSQISEENYTEGSPLDRNIFLVLIVMALAVVLARGVSLSKVAKANGWMFIFLVYCAISITWSDFPEVSFKRYIKEIGNLLMVLVVLSERVPVEAIIILVKRCTYILIPLSLVMIKYYPAFGRSYGRWTGNLSETGVATNKNSFGALCAVCGIGLIWNLVSMWRSQKISTNKLRVLVQGLMLITTIWLLFRAKSATSLVCFIIGAGVVAVMEVRAVRNIIAWTLPAILLLIGIILSGGPIGVLTGLVGRDETLTGRTEVWQKVMEMVENPMVGGGYSSFFLGDRLVRLWSEYSWHPTEAHNGYLEIYIDLGVIGIILLMGLIISSLRAIITHIRNDLEFGTLRLAFFTTVIMYNITESAFRPGLLMYFVFALVVIQMPRRSPQN